MSLRDLLPIEDGLLDDTIVATSGVRGQGVDSKATAWYKPYMDPQTMAPKFYLKSLCFSQENYSKEVQRMPAALNKSNVVINRLPTFCNGFELVLRSLACHLDSTAVYENAFPSLPICLPSR